MEFPKMFKKLKEKVIDSQTSQRFQQITQSVSDKFQNVEKDDNFFSLTEDDNVLNSSMSSEPGFSNISLTSTPQENTNRQRKTSSSSMTSEASFLPRYDSVTSIYHLQSDLDVSASEMDDNISTASSQIGHLSKEQIYSAFQKSQVRYHKYRGRFTDLSNHYKNLEREFNKLKTELEKNQERSFRRVKELKEQCELEQKAKAHLESSLRVDLDEKEYQIGTLKEKINILQNNPNMNLDIEQLTKNLNDTKQENENLNTMNQEIKAKLIILQSKEDEYKEKIKKLIEEMVKLKEEEKENNLRLAESKMMIHNEMLSKERELSDLRLENENLKKKLEIESKSNASTKLEQLQSQNKNLIEKVEVLSQKCQGLNNEVLKLEQYKLEIQNLKTKISEEKSAHDIEIIRLTEENKELKEKFFNERQEQVNIIDNLETMLFKNKETYETEINNLKKKIEDSSTELEVSKKNYEEQIEKLRKEAKQGIISLQEKMRVKFEEEFEIKEKTIKEELEKNLLSSLGVEDLQNKIVTLEKERNHIMHEMDALKEEFEKLSEYSNNDKKLIEDFNKNLKINEQILEEHKEKEKNSQEICETLISEKKNLENIIQSLREELTKIKIESDNKHIILNEHEELLLQYDRMKEEYDNLIKENADKQKLTENSDTENHENKEEFIKLQQENKVLGRSCSELQEKIKILEMKLEGDECCKEECRILDLKLKDSLKELELAIKKKNDNIDRNSYLEGKAHEMERKFNEIEEYLQNKEEELNGVKTLFEDLKVSSSKEIKKLNSLVESLTQTEGNTKRILADKEKNLEDLTKDLEVKIQYIKNLEENYKLLDKNEKDLKKEIEKYKLETDSKSKSLEKLENDYKEIQKLYSTEKKDITKQLSNLKQVEKNYYSLLDENENLKEQISEIAVLQEKLKSLSEVEKEKMDLKENIHEMKRKIVIVESLNKEYKTKLEYLNEFNEKINKLETERQQLFEEVAVLKEIKEEKNVAQKELNDIKNILQDVENKYEIVQLEFNNFKDIADSEKKELLNKYEDLDKNYKELSKENVLLQIMQNDYQRIQQDYDILKNNIQSEKKELNTKCISIENKYKEVCLEKNDNLQKISQLEQDILELTQKLNKVMQETDKNNKIREDIITEKEELKSKLFKIEISKKELESLLELNSKENNEMMEEISKLKGTINTLNKETQNLQESYAKANDLNSKYKQLQIEFNESNKIVNKLKAENEVLNQNNKQISSDYKNILEENNKLIAELEEFKLNLENYSIVKVKLEEDKIKINIEKKELLSRLERITEEFDKLKKENYDLRENKINKENNEVELLDVQQSYYEMKTKHDELCLENRELNKKIEELTKNIESFKEEKIKYENSIRELERHQNELMNEKLLLKEEIEELKTSPLNITSAKAPCEKINNFNTFKHNSILDNHGIKEMEQMEEKLTQLKSLDITNKATIDFYENEVQKLKTNNEKLNRRLDETLVTLNHCSELSQSTELEYLKNVLYNYMLGKEGLVLAKVIATVCKFDHEQTEEVLKKEHQKQTLLAKLGLL